LKTLLDKVLATPAKETCEVSLANEGSSPLILQIEAVATDSGAECRLVLIDITERKRTLELLHREKEVAEKLRREKEAAEEIARAKSQFLANVSHELRTPMTGILGMLQLALEEDLAPALQEYLETSLSSARSILRILNDILDMAKIEAGKIGIEEEQFSPRSCLKEVVDLMAPEARRKELVFRSSVADEVPDTVLGDQLRLRQVLLNIIGNAIKFTTGGEIAVQVTAGEVSPEGKRMYTFAVTDTGIGINDGKKELLFRAFSQVAPSHSRSYGGAGLGLAICKEIVNLLGGTIAFESKEGVGSAFSFTIPMAEAVPESAAPPTATPAAHVVTAPAPTGDRVPRILLAEDDPVNRRVLGLMFKHLNYELAFAEDGLQAVEMWETGGYDLVLMDVQMPQLDGFEATRTIRERERGGHTPIVAITAHARQEDRQNCLAAGMDAYISKPIDFGKCLQLIDDILYKKRGGAG